MLCNQEAPPPSHIYTHTHTCWASSRRRYPTDAANCRWALAWLEAHRIINSTGAFTASIVLRRNKRCQQLEVKVIESRILSCLGQRESDNLMSFLFPIFKRLFGMILYLKHVRIIEKLHMAHLPFMAS